MRPFHRLDPDLPGSLVGTVRVSPRRGSPDFRVSELDGVASFRGGGDEEGTGVVEELRPLLGGELFRAAAC
jgi:hypothetical protein